MTSGQRWKSTMCGKPFITHSDPCLCASVCVCVSVSRVCVYKCRVYASVRSSIGAIIVPTWIQCIKNVYANDWMRRAALVDSLGKILRTRTRSYRHTTCNSLRLSRSYCVLIDIYSVHTELDGSAWSVYTVVHRCRHTAALYCYVRTTCLFN